MKFLIVSFLLMIMATTTFADEPQLASIFRTGTTAVTAPQLMPVTGTLLYSPEGELVGVLQMDLLSFNRRERRTRQMRRAETRARRQNMTRLEKVGDHLDHNWGWYVGTLVLGTVDRIANNNDYLWYDWFRSSSSGSSSTPSAGNGGLTITGDGNTVIYQTAVDGAGMQANTGPRGE